MDVGGGAGCSEGADGFIGAATIAGVEALSAAATGATAGAVVAVELLSASMVVLLLLLLLLLLLGATVGACETLDTATTVLGASTGANVGALLLPLLDGIGIAVVLFTTSTMLVLLWHSIAAAAVVQMRVIHAVCCVVREAAVTLAPSMEIRVAFLPAVQHERSTAAAAVVVELPCAVVDVVAAAAVARQEAHASVAYAASTMAALSVTPQLSVFGRRSKKARNSAYVKEPSVAPSCRSAAIKSVSHEVYPTTMLGVVGLGALLFAVALDDSEGDSVGGNV